MTKRMLIDATHLEETRVAVVSGNRLEEYDYENAIRKQLKGNIYLVKVTRVEPSLQAAFVDFGGNRHGFLPFPEIHPDYYRIPIADREALLAEERAFAAEQAAKQDAEDEAELAAAGESLEDIEAEEDGEDDEAAVEIQASEISFSAEGQPSVASVISEVSIADAEETEEDTEEGAAEENEPGQEALASPETPGEADAQSALMETAAPSSREEEDLETVGGDSVEAPVYRSSIKRRYKIQEVIKRNQIMLIQISKEERGNKGAAVTSYISLPGRYCVLMPNSPRGGGVSRKVSNAKDRQRLKMILRELNVPEGMSVILRTAGVSRSKAEIKRDLDYLLRLWDQIRELTLKSTAPALIYEEGNLIKRAIRDLYRRDIEEVQVAGDVGHKTALEFMKTLMPSHAGRVHLYAETTIPLFTRYQVESQIDAIHSPTVHLKSGGYIVINPTEAMVSIDVNSGRATKGRHIEETALKTNLEAAEEIARQLRLRDQGGLIVIDFIDMEDKRGNRIVEKRLRDAMQHDRARIQLGRISAFGLLELSRQRLHPSLVETNFETCKHCSGTGLVRTVDTSAVIVLRAVEEEALKGRASEIRVSVPTEVALYLFNHKREMLADLERRNTIRVFVHADENMIKPAYTIDVLRASGVTRENIRPKHAPVQGVDISDLPEISAEDLTDDSTIADDETFDVGDSGDRGDVHFEGGRSRGGDRGDDYGDRGRRRGRRGGRRRGGGRDRGFDDNSRAQGSGGEGNPFPPDAPQPEVHGSNPGTPQEGREGEGRDRGERRGGRRGRGRRGRGRDRHHDHPRSGERQNAGTSRQNSAPAQETPSPRHETDNAPLPEESPFVPVAENNNDDDGSGTPRRGWWKRLTE